jgi:hypothetical protein
LPARERLVDGADRLKKRRHRARPDRPRYLGLRRVVPDWLQLRVGDGLAAHVTIHRVLKARAKPLDYEIRCAARKTPIANQRDQQRVLPLGARVAEIRADDVVRPQRVDDRRHRLNRFRGRPQRLSRGGSGRRDRPDHR